METVSRRRWKPLAVLAAAIALYWLAMFTATHLPFQTTPKDDPYSLDKLEHITAFAILAVLLCAAGAFLGISRLLLYFGVLAFIAVYAAVDELSQRFVAKRTPDFFDWLADIAGAAIGIGLFVLIRRLYVLRRARSGSISESAA